MFSAMVRGIAGAAALVSLATGAPAQDSYPQFTLAYFNLPACPTGWGPAVGANGVSLDGYFLVPFAPPVPDLLLGTTVNSPIPAGATDRVHAHTFHGSINLPEVKYAGIAGHGNTDTSKDGTMTFKSVTGYASSGMPFLPLLLCEKTVFTRNQNPPAGVPQYVVTFVATAYCPTGWKSAQVTSGRFLVGLPAGGAQATTFGGDPLKPGEDRTHTHAFSGSVTIPSTGVGLGAGCCAEHYGADGARAFQGATDGASTGLPYAIVTQCQPCLAGDTDPACQGQ